MKNTMRIKTFEDIEDIDLKLSGLFLRRDEAVHWIATVNSDIKDWIAKHKKQHWEVVRYVSEKDEMLGKWLTTMGEYKLSRPDFAKVLVKFCPEALSEGDTARALKANMDKYGAKMNAETDSLSGELIGESLALSREVRALFEHRPMPEPEATDERPSLVELMKEYLKGAIDESVRFPRSVVREREQYGDARPALSVETYYSQRFLDERRYSSAIAYEIVEEQLTESKFYELAGKYADLTQLKMFIVSTHGLLPAVKSLASKRKVGYVFLDPNRRYIRPDFLLPRSTEDHIVKMHNMEMLLGKRPMNCPMLIMDGDNVNTSLIDVLQSHDVQLKPRAVVDISKLNLETIEAEADKLSNEYVDICLRKSYLWDSDKELSVDPFQIAENLGLTYSIEPFDDDDQLGSLDLIRCHITLNASLRRDLRRMRFTMAHELGHFLLHRPWFSKYGLESMTETEHTLTLNVAYDQRLVEHQANLFAACLLMPKKLLALLYYYYYNRYISPIKVDDVKPLYYRLAQQETFQGYNNVVGRMANLLNVSLQALNIRLKSLHLLTMVDK